jgi:uncharacterized protein YbjT (DUF2867 family)
MAESSTVLITGASGMLGRSLLARPAATGYRVRAMSHRAGAARPAAGRSPGTEWVVADLATGDGVEAAVAGIDTIIHAASDPRGDARRTDVEGTERLLAAAEAGGVRHVVYVSIVGIDRVPYPYYRRKLETEDRIRSATVPWTILRGTQFHGFMDRLFRRFARYPVAFVPKSWLGQPVHVDEFADALWDCVVAGPGRRAPDVAGPEVLRYGDMMRAWLAAQRMRKPVLNLPIWGSMAAAFRSGGVTAPGRAVGRTTWRQWLAMRYGGDVAARGHALDSVASSA